jgi:type VI secretion system protein ImpF
MADIPYAQKSILNFGLPDIADRTIDEKAVDKIPEEIRTAIMQYEPRLARASLHIERDMSVDPTELKVRFLVRADLTCDPVHVPVEFVADVIDTGKILVNRL